MATWEYKVESVNALSEDTQRFIIALYPDGVLYERSNIDVPTSEVNGLGNGELTNAIAPYVKILVEEVSLNYETDMAAKQAEMPIQQAVDDLPDEFISVL